MSRINAVFTSLLHEASFENKDLSLNAVSSLADIWINLENEKQQAKRIRSLRVVKARGLAHENEAVKFTITNKE
jgi:circadian clock protein KaiC